MNASPWAEINFDNVRCVTPSLAVLTASWGSCCLVTLARPRGGELLTQGSHRVGITLLVLHTLLCRNYLTWGLSGGNWWSCNVAEFYTETVRCIWCKEIICNKVPNEFELLWKVQVTVLTFLVNCFSAIAQPRVDPNLQTWSTGSEVQVSTSLYFLA